MSSQHKAEVEALFNAAVALLPSERRALLDSSTGSDAELRAEVESLLAHHDASSQFLAVPAIERDLASDTRFHGAAPQRIGAYRVERELGRGGMGVVYLAEQEHPRREVALKVIGAGFASAHALRRFEHEAQLLARLQHPGIAQIFEAGTADYGAGPQPYFAMEYVRGRTLAQYVADKKLGTRERLALLAEVCDALEHAHHRGVVHRDLKPSNILVDESGERAQIKVLDFGVARATDGDVQATSLRTDIGQVIGTLPYMSPEQAGGDPAAIDHRSDVYSLGVVGYEMLSGRLPLDVLGKPLHEAVRIVREDDPTPLSSAAPVLRGDVETIFAKALEKDRERRYGSAAELAADLRRYLSDRPIVARPASRMYVLSKFARRNKVLVGGIAGVFVALVIGMAGTSWQAHVAAAERDRADEEGKQAKLQALRADQESTRATAEALRATTEARRATAGAQFQRDMLSRIKPTRDGRDVKLAEVLDAAAATVATSFADDPAGAETIRSTLADSYEALGLLAEAQREYAAAVDACVSAYGVDADATWVARKELGDVLLARDSVAEAETLLRGAREHCQRVFGDEDERTLRAMHSVISLELRMRHVQEAEQLARRVLEIRRRNHPDDARPIATALSELGITLWRLGRMDEAAQALGEALEMERALPLVDEPSIAKGCNNLANVLRLLGQLERSEELYREAVEIGRRMLGTAHHDLWVWLNNLAVVLQDQKKHADAEPLMREVWERRLAYFGEDNEQTLIALNNLALLLTEMGRYDEAEPLHRRALAVKERVLGVDDVSTLKSRHNLALVVLLGGDNEGALPLFRECAERAPKAYPPGHWAIASFRESHGGCLQRMQRFDEAEPELLAALELMRGSFDDGNAKVQAIQGRLHDMYVAWGKPEKAALFPSGPTQ